MSRKIAALSLFVCMMISVFMFAEEADLSKSQYTYDENHVRYELYQSNGGQPYNWLFFPGGPGADSSYLRSLVDELNLPGKVWLIDLPGNGSNISENSAEDFDQWFDLFPKIVQQFENPVLVGHSFGAMFPLLFPELENDLKGLVLLNGTPGLWMEEAVVYAKQFNLPDFSKEMHAFVSNPSQETFQPALEACMACYFPKSTLEKGKELLAPVACRYQPAVWWQNKVVETNFSAKWVPQNVPTLVVGSKYDCVCPYTLFQKDMRFHRPNVEFLYIEDAGHLIWVENPLAAKEAFKKMTSRLAEIN